MELKDLKQDKIKEIWQDILGYEGLYQVSNLGRIKSYRTNQILKPHIDKNGYLRTTLQKTHRKDTKAFYIHRLVANAFISNIENKPYINHKDENKSNNCYLNLEWCSIKENMNYGTRNKRISISNKNNEAFSKKIVCLETNKIYESIKEAERQTGICAPNICKCLKNIRQFAGGYTWKYL